jgi:hypothetical protein
VPVVTEVVAAGVVVGAVPEPAVGPVGGVCDDGPVVAGVVAGAVAGVAGIGGVTVISGAGAGAGTQSSRRDPVSCRPANVPVPAVTLYRYQIGAPTSTGGRNDVRATVTDPALVLTVSVPVVTPSAMLPGAFRSPATATGPPRAVIWAVPWNLNSAPTSGLARVAWNVPVPRPVSGWVGRTGRGVGVGVGLFGATGPVAGVPVTGGVGAGVVTGVVGVPATGGVGAGVVTGVSVAGGVGVGLFGASVPVGGVSVAGGVGAGVVTGVVGVPAAGGVGVGAGVAGVLVGGGVGAGVVTGVAGVSVAVGVGAAVVTGVAVPPDVGAVTVGLAAAGVVAIGSVVFGSVVGWAAGACWAGRVGASGGVVTLGTVRASS